MRRTSALLALALAAAAGCETKGLYDEGIAIASIERLESGLAVRFDSPDEAIALVEVSATGLGVRELFAPEEGERIVRTELGPDPAAAEELFVFTAPVDEREIDIVDSVVRVAPAAAQPQRFGIGSYFGALAFHPDGRYALLYHTEWDEESSGGLFNPNEVGVIDLGRPPAADNPRLFTVAMGGRAVRGVAFPGPLTVAGQSRDLAVFEADGAVVLVDLADPGVEPLTVKLKDESDTREIVPAQLIARPADEAHDTMLILRAPGAQEIFAVSLVARPDGQPGFAAALNQYDSGLAPSAMCLAEDGDTPLLVVAGEGSSRISVIDVGTASSFFVELSGEVTALLPHARADGAAEVVMYGASFWVHFLAVEDLAEEKGSNLEELFVEGGIASAWKFGADALLAMPAYDYGLTLVDLTAREVTRLTANDWYEWPEAAAWGDRLFYAAADDDRVISLDLEVGHPEPLVLDEPVAAFAIFPGPAMGLVLHGRPTGRATLFPLAAPTREKAVVIDGLWLDGLLDREEVGL